MLHQQRDIATKGDMATDTHASRFGDIFGNLRDGIGAVRRGRVRLLILSVLREQPMHGYQVIGELEARSGGRWRPSAGSVYPTLQQLEDEGMVRSEEQDRRRVYTLTDEGRAAADETPLRHHPWFDKSVRGEATDLRRAALQLIGAAMQVKRVGSPQAQRAAREILADSRRKLYELLAADDADAAAGGPAE